MPKIIRDARGAHDALFAFSMLLRLETFDDEVDDEELDTQLMPAKHGAKSPTVASHGRLQVPSPYPSPPTHYASGVQKKVTRPPPPPENDPPDLFSLFAELYSSVEPTGSDVHAPVHRLEDGAPVLPTAALASPAWVPAWGNDFDSPVASSVAPIAGTPKKKSHIGSAIVGGVLGIACGFFVVSIANGTITSKDARSALARGALVVDALLSYH